ncbi:MAG: hypothetical protein QXX95_01100 [Nitrososphaerales archaeon]
MGENHKKILEIIDQNHGLLVALYFIYFALSLFYILLPKSATFNFLYYLFRLFFLQIFEDPFYTTPTFPLILIFVLVGLMLFKDARKKRSKAVYIINFLILFGLIFLIASFYTLFMLIVFSALP